MYTHRIERVSAASSESTPPADRPHALGIDPGHERCQPQAERDHDVDQQPRSQGCRDAAGQVVATLHRAGEDQFGGAEFEVTQQRVADEQGGDQHAEQGEDAQHLRDHRRRIAVHVAARPAATAAENAAARAARTGRS
ncbi:hypothetical protein G6F56_013395 [Rhizopus delemar]|nr:hypothetical protein G6F56_013395 [Rhizopus delemar]